MIRVTTPPVWVLGPTGNQVSATTSAAKVQIPNAGDGNRAWYVAVQSSALAYVKLQKYSASAAVTVNDFMVNANAPVILATGQYDGLSYLADSGTVKVNITPVEMN